MTVFLQGPSRETSESTRRWSEASQDTMDLLQEQNEDNFEALNMRSHGLGWARLLKITLSSFMLACVLMLISVAVYYSMSAQSAHGNTPVARSLNIEANKFGAGKSTLSDTNSVTDNGAQTTLAQNRILQVEETPKTTPNPTPTPTRSPSQRPSTTPTKEPSQSPTTSPSTSPTDGPTQSPSMSPSQAPSQPPTDIPTNSPTDSPSTAPTNVPSNAPTDLPTTVPTMKPSVITTQPTSLPTATPTREHYGSYDSSQLDADISKHYKEHDPSCTRALVYATTHWYGLGSQWNNMLLNYVTSLWESRALVMQDNWMVDYRCNNNTDEGTYASCFKSFLVGPGTCDVNKLRGYAKNYTDLPLWDCNIDAGCKQDASPIVQSHGIMYHGGYHVFSNERGRMPCQVGDNKYNYFDLEVYAIKRLWNLKDDVQQRVDQWINSLGLEGTVCGFHVRRGDKVSGGLAEAEKEDIVKYFIEAQKSGLKCDTCFFSSDDMVGVHEEVNSKINEYLPGCKIRTIDFKPLQDGGYNWWAFRHSEGDVIVEQTLQFLAALEVFSRKCHFFVGTFSSNVGRLIALLRSARGWHPGTSASTDTPTWYWGRRLIGGEREIVDEKVDFDYAWRRGRAPGAGVIKNADVIMEPHKESGNAKPSPGL